MPAGLTPLNSTIENAGDIQANASIIYAPLVIDPVFGDSIETLTGDGPDPTTAAQIENAVSAAIDFYDTNFTSSVPAVFNDGTISNTVTVDIQFDYGTVDGSTMGYGSVSESESTGPVYVTYAQLLSALSVAPLNLPAADPTDGGGFLVPDAQGEVLGLAGINPGVGSYVGLNTIANGVTFDYNLADQSVPGEVGVLGSLEHEIAEDFGRIAIDGTEADQENIGSVVTMTKLYSILDLFRFSAPGTPALSPGPSDYFSLDDGTTALGAFNNFTNGGDAGDWASSVAADSFDAFLSIGTAGTISALDRMVLGAIGLLPAPVEVTISGGSANQTTSDTLGLALFDNVAVVDRQANQIETVTVTASAAANGTLSNLGGGSYDVTTGVYQVSGSPESVSTALDGLVFNPTPHQAAAGQSVTTGFTINVTDTAGASASDGTTSVIATETAVPASVVNDAYVAILRMQPDASLLDATVAQIAAGQLTIARFETSLITGAQAIYTTLPALVTIDAFYDATPAGALLTTVAAATSGTPYDTAAELHDLGYSAPNVWTILGAGWGADHGSAFFGLYSADATGTTAGYTAFLDAAYQQEFGIQPAPANLGNLLADIPGLTALLSGGGNVATPIQVMGGLYGYLLYAGQTNDIGHYATAADAFLQAAANGAVTYGPELTREFPAAIQLQAADSANVVSSINAELLIDPGVGDHTMRFLSGGEAGTAALHPGMGQMSGFDSGSDIPDLGALLSGTGVKSRDDVAALGNFLTGVDQRPDAIVRFDRSGQRAGGTIAVSRGPGSTVISPETRVTRGAISL